MCTVQSLICILTRSYPCRVIFSRQDIIKAAAVRAIFAAILISPLKDVKEYRIRNLKML